MDRGELDAQSARRVQVECYVTGLGGSGQDDSVAIARRIDAHVVIEHILANGLRIALQGIPEAAAATVLVGGDGVRWQLDLESPHDIAASQGAWQLIRIEDGRSTLVRYQSRMDAGRSLPDFVEDLLLRRSLRKMLTSLRGEVIARYGESPSEAPPSVDVAAPPESDR